ncbi:hypothetical protein Tco_0369322 [Tanacetum coccineum]
MASLDRRLNPLYAIKECSSCGNLHTKDCGCSKGSLEDKILVPIPDLSQRPLKIEKNCLDCGDPVHGLYCRQCALIRKTLEEVFQDFQDTSKSSNDNTNFVNQEHFIVNSGPGVNSSQSPPQINHNCCYECGDSLDDIFCQRCTCKSCGKGAHYGYNCPPQILIISKPESCNNQTVNEFPQTLQSVQPTSCTRDENSFTYDSKPYFVDDSLNIFNPPPQPPILFNAQNDFLNSQNKLMEQMTSICDMVGQYMQKKEEEKRIAEEQAAKDRYWKIPICYDDDEDYTIAIAPVLPTKEPVNSLSMGDEHLDTIPATESDQVIKSSVENLVPIPSESEGIPDSVCDVPFCNNPTPLEAFKEHSKTIIDSNNDSSSSDDDSYENLDYVDASPPDAEIVSLEVVEIVIPEWQFHLSCDFSYDSFIFDLSINPFPPADRSDFHHEEFADELAHIISPPEYDHFCFKTEPELGNLTMDVVNDIFPTREPKRIARIFEASRARGFVLRSQELQILSFILGIRYPNLID